MKTEEDINKLIDAALEELKNKAYPPRRVRAAMAHIGLLGFALKLVRLFPKHKLKELIRIIQE